MGRGVRHYRRHGRGVRAEHGRVQGGGAATRCGPAHCDPRICGCSRGYADGDAHPAGAGPFGDADCDAKGRAAHAAAHQYARRRYADRGPHARAPGAVITEPGVGQVATGPVAIFGTASVDNFQFYKLEYGAGENPAVWSYFGGGDSPVVNGRLGTLNVLPPGTYSIRVVSVDQSGNFPPPCQTTITFR
jgi:hypothetical protein